MDSILLTIRALLGPAGDPAFDTDIMIWINSAFMVLYQLGVGPKAPFRIHGETEKWSDFLLERGDLEAVKSYVYLKTKLGFDPPTSSYVLDAFKNEIAEHEWRLLFEAEGGGASG